MIFGIDNGQDMTSQHVKECRDRNNNYSQDCIEKALVQESSEMEKRRTVSSQRCTTLTFRSTSPSSSGEPSD